MGILQARILEWVAMPSPRGSSQPMRILAPGSPCLPKTELELEKKKHPKPTPPSCTGNMQEQCILGEDPEQRRDTLSVIQTGRNCWSLGRSSS